MAFRPAGSLELTNSGPLLRRNIIANSVTITVNDSVKLASGFVALGTAGAAVYGHVIALGSKQGLGLLTTGVTGAEFGSFINTFATASDNQTVSMVKADVDISKFSLYGGTYNATPGTTTGSNLAGYHIDLIDEDELDEDTAATTTAQYTIQGMYTTTEGSVNIYESQVL